MLGPNNSFLGFHALKKIKHLFLKESVTIKQRTSGVVAVAPYGGMFFKKELLEAIGLPNEAFFLYADDHDFSYRITQNKGKIILVLDSILKDLEMSFHLKNKKERLSSRFFKTNSKEVIYYSVRNNTYFQNNFVTNNSIYLINKYCYLTLLFSLMLCKPKHYWKFSVIVKAIRDSKKLE